MRHLTENAGFRPSTFARTRPARHPRRGSDEPAECGRCSPNCHRIRATQISQFKTNLFCFSVQPRNRSANVVWSTTSDTARSTSCHMAVNGVSALRRWRPLLLRSFDEAQHLADADRFRRARQQVSALRAAARFHEAALFQAGEDEFQEFLRNALAARDVRDLTGSPGRCDERSKIACSAYSPFTEMFIGREAEEFRVSQ